MATLHIRNVSETLIRRLKSEAAIAGMTLKEYVVDKLDGAEPRKMDLWNIDPAAKVRADRGVHSKDSAEMPTAPTLSVDQSPRTLSMGIAKAKKSGDKWCPHGIVVGGRCSRCE